MVVRTSSGLSSRRRPLTTGQRVQKAEARTRALHALSLARRGMSPSKAARLEHTTLDTMKRRVESALERLPSGRYRATPFDRMKRPMKVPTEEGPVTLDITDSRTASKLARYWNAVHHYLKTGDDSLLKPFQGKGIRIGGEFFPFITDLPTLERLARAGEIQFEDIYEQGV